MPERAVQIPSPARSWLRELAWSRALHALKRHPGSSLPLPLADRLIRTWGDETTSVTPEYLVLCYRSASQATGTILDFGAGVTTIVMAIACRSRPASVVAFDHEPERRQRVLSELGGGSRRSGDVRLVPLGRQADVVWPTPDLRSVRRPLAFVAMHPIAGLSEPREAWEGLLAAALPETCPVVFQ